MKKTYKNPELEVVKIQTMQMMAVSSLDMGGGDKDPATEADAPYLEDDFDWSE